MKILSIVALLVYTFGIYAFGVLSWYQLRGSSRGDCHVGTPRIAYSRITGSLSTAITLVSLVWFLVMLLLTLENPTGLGWVQGMQVLLLFSFPPLIIHLGYAEALDRNPARVPHAFRLVHWIAWPLSQLLSFGLVLSFFDVIDVVPRRLLGPILGFSISALFAATAVHGVLLLTRTKQRVESPRQQSARRWMAGMFLFLLVLLGIIVGIAVIVGIGYGVGNQNSEIQGDIEVSIDEITETAIETQGKQFYLELNDSVTASTP